MPQTNYAKALCQRNSGWRPDRQRSGLNLQPGNLRPMAPLGLAHLSKAVEDPFADNEAETWSDPEGSSGASRSDNAQAKPPTPAQTIDPEIATAGAVGIPVQQDMVFRNYSDIFRGRESLSEMAGNASVVRNASVADRASGSARSAPDERINHTVQTRGLAGDRLPDSLKPGEHLPGHNDGNAAKAADKTVIPSAVEQHNPREIDAILADIDKKMKRFTEAAPRDKTHTDPHQVKSGIGRGDSLLPEKQPARRQHSSATPQLQPQAGRANAAKSSTAGKYTQVSIGTLSVEITPAAEKASARQQQTANRSRGRRQGRIAGAIPSAGRFGLGQW